MTEDVPVAGTPLDPGLFSGKRSAPRKRRTLVVEAKGPSGQAYAGKTVDVSRGGMLLELTDVAFRSVSAHADLVSFASRIATTFPTGMDVSFGEGAVRAKAHVVRVLAGGAASTLLLGCRFEPPLEIVDCRLLGVEAGGNEIDKGPSPATSWQAAEEEERALVQALLTGRDELLNFIQNEDRPWDGSGRGGGTAVLPPDVSARVAHPAAPARPKPTVVPETEAPAPRTPMPRAVEDRGALPRVPVASPPPPVVVGIPDQALRDLKSASPSKVLALGSPPSPVWASPGTVVTHLFPTAPSFVGPRFTGRAIELRTRGVIVDLVAPAGEASPLDWAAHLGTEVRAVFLREGRVLWEAKARVQRLMAAGAGVVLAILLADAEPPAALRRVFAPPPPSERGEAS